MSLKVIALGTGVCAEAEHTAELRYPPGFLVDVDGKCILLDCSEGIRFRIGTAGYRLAQISHVAVTHAHPDHAALPQFIQAKFCQTLFGAKKEGRAADLEIFLPSPLARQFSDVWRWHQPENKGEFWNDFTPNLVDLEDGDRIELWPGTFLHAIRAYHGYGQHPAMGFRVETSQGIVAYTGDSGLCDGVRRLAEGADLLIADCCIRIGQEYTAGYGHMGPKQCGEVAMQGRVKELWLTHWFDVDTPQAMEYEVRATGYHGALKVARDGDQWQPSSSR